MKRDFFKPIRCPICQRNLKLTDVRLETTEIEEASLCCDKGHQWDVITGIPRLLHPPLIKEDQKWVTEYDEMAPRYDELVLQYNDFLGIDIMREREQIGVMIPHEGNVRMLEVSIGTGANVVALKKYLKDGLERIEIHGLDVSEGMLAVAREKMMKSNIPAGLIRASVFNLPYTGNYFDVVLHSGGINTFSDITKAMEEMLRVTRKGGIVIIIDEGLSPKLRNTDRGKAIIEQNTLFAYRPPLEQIPDTARDIEISYVMGETFYQLILKK